jgi:NAD+ synthase
LKRLDQDSLRFNPEKTLPEILHFIRTKVKAAKASGVVVGLSGGVDSTLTAALCVQALGKERVLGVLMPTSFTPEQDVADAAELAKILGIETKKVGIDGICKSFIQAVEASAKSAETRIPLANVRARTRMVILYYYANSNNLLVAGTGDRSEYLIGFYTKHGDGAADFFPIIHLYKTQVRELTNFLGVPERMAMKPSSPQLYPGHKLSDEIPLDYDKLDPILVGLVDLRLPPGKVSEMADVPLEIVMEIVNRHKRSEHKRKPPLTVRAE